MIGFDFTFLVYTKTLDTETQYNVSHFSILDSWYCSYMKLKNCIFFNCLYILYKEALFICLFQFGFFFGILISGIILSH